MREVIVTGKTVEEATEKACLELGLPREEVSIEILEMPTRKLFKSTPAKVKATADEAEAPAVEEKPAPQPVKAEAKKDGFNVVQDYAGHGIGRDMHMLPYILHFANNYGGKMVRSACSVRR